MASRAGSLSLVGGVLALDFANTASGRHTGEPFEHIRAATDLVDWARHAGSLGEAAARRAQTAIGADADAAERMLHYALRLRDAIYLVGSAIARGQAPPKADLATLKDFARKTIGPAEFKPAREGLYAFDFSTAPPETALLGPVAWSAIDLLQRGNLDRIKQCPGEDCGWLFLDGSKNNSRRWCDMATCGNRTKGRRHRERH